MRRHTLTVPTLTISVPANDNPHKPIISNASSPAALSPTRNRRQMATVRSRPLRPRPLLRAPTEPLASRSDSPADDLISPYRPRAATIDGIKTMLSIQPPAKGRSFLTVEEPDIEATSPVLAPDDITEIREFLKRKDWIEEKIRLYETMPDIDVFAGADELALHPGQPITGAGLPTQEDYEFWLKEQQAIESEMEYFDKGDLHRLKKFAKTKSRETNLSAEDTDLVELALTTLLALEKLNAHLRRRADRIEALRLRLLWEDQRLEAWKERQDILADLESFVKRARWSPSSYNVYNDPNPEPDTAALFPLTTLDSSSASVTDVAPPSYERSRTVSANSTTLPVASVIIPQSLLPSPHTDFSRAHRFTLADGLSREAATYVSRVMAFKSSRITTSANTLEKLIAVSREKVPDEILNEQDKLEVKSSVLDGLGRFGMNIAMQWTKADQSFGDLKRVQAMAETLTRDILAAKVQHPTSRQNEVFQERLKIVTDKVKSLVDPSTSRSFPRPLHPSYQDQHASNQYILSVLGVEVSKARTMASEASAAAEEYQMLFKAIVYIDKQVDQMGRLVTRLSSATERIINGAGLTKDRDDTPIDISTEACLDPAKHMHYLTSLPNLTWELDDADELADRVISTSRGTLADLEEAGVDVDPKLKLSVEKGILGLEAERMKSEKVLDEVTAKSGFLREARELHNGVHDISRAVSLMRQELAQVAEEGRWKLVDDDDDMEIIKDAADLVEEDVDEEWTIIEHPGSSGAGSSKSTSSPSSYSASSSSSKVVGTQVDPSKDFHRRIDEISSQIASHVSPRQSQLLPALAPRLANHIARAYDVLINDIAVLREAIRTWEEIRRQAKVMADVRADARSLMEKAEEMRCKLLSTRRSVSREDSPNADGGALIFKHNLISSQYIQLQEDIGDFVRNLPNRVPLLTSTATARGPRLVPHANPNPVKIAASRIFSFSLADLDDDVKTDANAIAAKLDEASANISSQLAQLRIVGYVFYCSSFIVPSRISPMIGFNRIALKMSQGIISGEWYLAALITYIRSFKEGIFGDGGKSQLEQFQHMARLQFAQLSQDLATIRREYEQEREERLRSQREFKKEMEVIVEQLRAQTTTPGRVSTARLEEIASSLANLTAFVNDSESTREEDRALERMRQIALSMQRTVTFAPRNPFESPST